nr:SDR family oxidoreductase [Halopseudomonas yangmingensis]
MGGRVLVTGASGFIGSHLVKRLIDANQNVLVVGRRRPALEVEFLAAELDDSQALQAALTDVDVVIHLAGRAHVMRESHISPLDEFRRVNRDLALHFATQAKHSGVRRFVFISSIGVNGAVTQDAPFSELSNPAPHADYALSKFEAEQELERLFSGSDTELVIIRPPLVYGADAPGNFSRLLKLVRHGVPLPLAAVQNQRSMICLDNLVDFIMVCASHPAAANQCFLVSDNESVSTPELVRLLAEGMGRKARLLPCPDFMLRLGSRLVGRAAMYTQLCQSLVVDTSKAHKLLGWRPQTSAYDALRTVGQQYLQTKIR